MHAASHKVSGLGRAEASFLSRSFQSLHFSALPSHPAPPPLKVFSAALDGALSNQVY